MSIRQYLRSIPDLKMIQRQVRTLQRVKASYVSPDQARSLRMSTSHLHPLLARRFKFLFREMATVYFKKKIDMGELSLEDLRKNCGATKKSADMTLERLIFTTPLAKLVSLIPEKDRKALTLNSALWRTFWRAVDCTVSVRTYQLQDACCRHFLSLFTKKELQEPGSWKVCYAHKFVKMQTSNLPVFMHDKLRDIMKGLPAHYAEKVALWDQKQTQIAESTRRVYKNLQHLFGDAVDVEQAVRDGSFSCSIAEDQEGSMNAIKGNHAERLPSFPMRTQMNDEMPRFLRQMLEVQVIHDLWKDAVAAGVQSEEKFQSAYKQWDGMAIDDLVSLIQKAVFPKQL